MADRLILEAREPFSLTMPGQEAPTMVAKGDRYWSDDPLVAGREHLFVALQVRSSGPGPHSGRAMETATAAPGERRTVTPRPAPASPPPVTANPSEETAKPAGEPPPPGPKATPPGTGRKGRTDA